MKSLLVLSILFWAFVVNAQTTCEYTTSPWGACVGGLQNRTLSCICGTQQFELSTCEQLQLSRPEKVQTCTERICLWKWTRWTKCSAPCDGGNTTRDQICICNEEDQPANETECDMSSKYGEEVAECNTFSCDNVPAFNKLYWIMRAEEGHWPMPDSTFNCSLGYDLNVSSPHGKHYSTILRDNHVTDRPHPDWYYLAKEWIAAQLNVANGVPFPEPVLQLIVAAGALLEKCDGFNDKDLYFAYATKEKLARINNNIGGLDHVDDQVFLLVGGNEGKGNDELSKKSTFIMVLVIPGLAILVVLIVAGVTVYYVRRKSAQIVEKEHFESEEEGDKAKNVPLEQEGQAEKFDEEQ